ncbi:unnamed protein product [Phaedon cochleariae]|uniref:Major facilitator superfamily (MFS) profile domain-containing protein n=1 Tax=Phaedon cochleariae TaxID=80249 RepID=A0A9N9X484_PHACE|nr:unnamed protein product [Phaedon cochleariae]
MFLSLYSTNASVNPLDRPITQTEDAWIVSLVPLGAVIGPFLFGYLSDRLGRKIGLLLTSTPLIASSFILAFFSSSVYVIYFARLIAGFSMGAGYALLPVYLSEIAEDSNRGMVSQALNIFWSFGNFISCAVGPFLPYMVFNIVIGCIPTAFFVVFLLWAPESPYYLVSKGDIEGAKQTLTKLRMNDEKVVEEEMASIKEFLEKDKKGGISEVFSNPPVRRAFIICTFLVFTQELCGFSVFLMYMQPIFEAAGIGLSSDKCSLIMSVVIITSSFINPFFIDKAGRKILIVMSCFGMFISLTLVGAFFYIKTSTDLSTDPITWLPIFSLIFFIFAFNFGLGAVPWTLTSEMFPNNLKQVVSTTISASSWLASAVLTRFYNDMNDSLGRAGSFWFFAGYCLISGIVSLIFLPETKGKSFAEIQDMLQSDSIIYFRSEARAKKEVRNVMSTRF